MWRALLILILLPIMLLLLPFVLLMLPFMAVSQYATGHGLARAFRNKWRGEGRFVLFVHSDSPVWASYLATQLFPRIQDHCVFLNWSQRKQWETNKPLEARMLEHFGGEIEFNPMAIIVPPRGRVREVRFYLAFHDFKHGKEAKLRECEAALIELIHQHTSLENGDMP
jgi:hypothetical protein